MKLFGAAVILMLVFSSVAEARRGVAAPRISSWHKSAANRPSPQSVGAIWSDCSKDTDKLKIGSVSVSPDPPTKGNTLTVKANVTFLTMQTTRASPSWFTIATVKSISEEDVTSGQLKINLSIDKIHFISDELDLCDIASQAGLSCPIKAGVHQLNVQQEIPADAPSGDYTGNQYLYDQNKNELVCIALTLHL